MVSVPSMNRRTIANSMIIATTIATREDGMTLKIRNGSFGRNSITAMETTVMTIIHASTGPSLCSKGWSWELPIIRPSPLQKPIITGEGNRRMNLDKSRAENTSMRNPANITEGNKSSTPAPFPPSSRGSGRNVEIMAANAPVAPFTMPGLPPNTLQMSPTIQAACKATGGFTLAINANATDSGICAQAMVTPNRTSLVTNSLLKSLKIPVFTPPFTSSFSVMAAIPPNKHNASPKKEAKY
mmetsp:Transcript_48462/g.105514  ORF Transcript_48462/g.105514 Transcript_48462/m.105514 type:complete len:241 (-) Transcript_48462:4-726(-)